jgi:UDP-2,3-diacylglucosamine pyrophosphatase LpxH
VDATIRIISDLHLGGEAPSPASPGFQICSAEGQRLLADFLQWTASAPQPLHLVINGDSVDFLAEAPFEPFSPEPSAETKLNTIFERTAPIWTALAGIVETGAGLTVTLGNHDLELTLPAPRRLLRDKLGPGRVDLLLDNTALTIGPVLIEHGNRYDGWNAVNHDALRRVRSAVSRGEDPEEFPVPPGTRLVIDVMNEIKQEFRFVDLLKPEQETVLPMLAALKPSLLGKINRIRKLKDKAGAVRYSAQGQPEDRELIAARSSSLSRKLAEAAGGDAEEISMTGAAIGILARWLAEDEQQKRQATTHIIYELFQTWLGANFTAFDTAVEAEEYLRPARAAASRGFKVISYGHTHLAKRVAIAGSFYLNTGTWADLMAVPRSILLNSAAPARQELDAFIDDLAHNRLDRWKTTLPTFAEIELRDGAVQSAGVFTYHGNGQALPLSQGRLVPLGVAAAGGA